MSDTNETTQGTAPAAVSSLPPISYEVVQFRKGGAAEEFSFTSKVYNNLSAAVTDLSENAILDLVNAEVAARIGMKARNSAGFNELPEVSKPDFAAKKDALVASLVAKYPSKVIYSEADAQAWKPGEREITMGSVQKKVAEAIKNLAAAKTPEALALAQSQFTQYITQLQTIAQRAQERATVV